MDVVYFLKKRTNFVRFYYDKCVIPFATIKHQIENETPPFDNPSYHEDAEPPYLNEWMDADSAIQLAGLASISLLSDSLKLYFRSLQHRVLGFRFNGQDPKNEIFREGFLAAYKEALGYILDTDWSDCPADFKIIEQLVLARNRSQHGSSLSSLDVSHDKQTLNKHPRPFFANEEELESWAKTEATVPSSLFMPNVQVTRESLFAAIEHVEKLADWIEGRMDRAAEWRMGKR